MTIWSEVTRFLVISLAVTLAACVSPTSPQKTDSGRYDMADDSPLLEPIDLSAVQSVIPEPVTRTLAGNKSPYTVNGGTYYVMDSEQGYEETGTASWYGRKFHGHLTSNGEIYDMFTLSAAHKSLPIPSFLEVTNLDNGKSVVVRVNDRGPFHEDRIVDLSYAAAATLDYAANGTARVRVKSLLAESFAPVSQPGPDQNRALTDKGVSAEIQEEVLLERNLIEQNAGEDFLQVGAFSNIDSARQILAKVSEYTVLPVFIRSDADEASGTLLHRVRLGPVNETIDLQALVRIFIEAGLGTPFRVRQ
ncbi:MAG: rare lipoprotein A [Pseudohongiellaceae bacterium]